MNRYETLAHDIADLIGQGALRAGDRLPSVRQTSSSRRVSAATVFQAYYLLEARGLIEARPRSGYFVRQRPRPGDSGPALTQPAASAAPVQISELVFKVLAASKRRDLVPFGSAFPSPLLFPLDKLARAGATAMRRLDPWRTVLDLAPGSERLRRQIAMRYLVDGVKVADHEIVITNGAMEALNLSLQALTEPGDVVVLESPTFYAALQAVERLRLRAVQVASHPRTGIDLPSLAAALERHAVKACWLMPSFQNPGGSLMPEARRRELVALLARHRVPLIEDDVYAQLYFGRDPPRPAKAHDEQGLVLHCSSFSKCLAPGYRVGWVAAGRFAQRIEQIKLMSTLGAAVPSQEAIAEYLESGAYDRHLRRLRRALATQQAQVLEAIARHFPAGTRVAEPEGGYFLWLQLPHGVDALALHARALDEGIGIAPGPVFSADEAFADCIRLNTGHPADAQTEAALRRLGRLALEMARP